MTQDEIIHMARGAGLVEPYHPYNPWSASQEELERFAALVAAHEREACAKLLEDAAYTGRIISCTSAAKAIRARSNK